MSLTDVMVGVLVLNICASVGFGVFIFWYLYNKGEI